MAYKRKRPSGGFVYPATGRASKYRRVPAALYAVPAGPAMRRPSTLARNIVRDAEKKYQDVDIDNGAVGIGGTFQNTDSFVKIAQGTTKNTRIGNKISVCNWNMHGTVILPASATQSAETVRIIVGIDKQANGAVPLVTDVLEVAEYDSFRAMDSVDRFKILKEKWITLNTQVASATAGQYQQHFKINLKKLDVPIHYNSTAGAITELRSNSLFVLAISSGSTAVLDFQSRVKFYDM